MFSCKGATAGSEIFERIFEIKNNRFDRLVSYFFWLMFLKNWRLLKTNSDEVVDRINVFFWTKYFFHVLLRKWYTKKFELKFMAQ